MKHRLIQYLRAEKFNITEADVSFKGKITVEDMREGVACLEKCGRLLGKDNLIYRSAVEGINERMNTDIEQAFSDERLFECFVAEAIIQNLKAGAYIDLTDVKNGFKYEHFRRMACPVRGSAQTHFEKSPEVDSLYPLGIGCSETVVSFQP